MSRIVKASYTFNRAAPTTTYGANDLVANSATAGSVVPIKLVIGKGGFKIKHIQVLKADATDVANADFDLFFYATETEPTTTVGDNVAWSKASTPVDGYIGTVTLDTMTAASDDASSEISPGHAGYPEELVGFCGANGTIYAFLRVQGAYTPPASEEFKVKIVVEKFEGNS